MGSVKKMRENGEQNGKVCCMPERGWAILVTRCSTAMRYESRVIDGRLRKTSRDLCCFGLVAHLGQEVERMSVVKYSMAYRT